jgi:transposase
VTTHVLSRIREGERIFADETTLPTLNPGAGKTKTAWLWAYARDDRPFGGAEPPMVAYRFEESRSGDCAARHLGDYRGILQCDGYAGYRKIAGGAHSNGMRLAGCWAHLRRKFFDLHANGESVVATATVAEMRQLWAIEDEVRGQPSQARLAARRAASVAVVQSLFDVWERELPRISGKSKLAEAIRYARSHRAALELFLEDGRAEIDSNIVERAIRPQAITRKNALFAGSAGGGRTWAAIATMLQTCKMNDVDPYAWAILTLERIANRWPNKDIEALMPWNFKTIG